ncbi:hypothetical protein ACHAXT_010849 [Thalassiosira profunda]
MTWARAPAARTLLRASGARRWTASASARSVAQVSANSMDASVPPKFYVPRGERAATDSIYEFDSVYDRRLKRRRRIDPTRELNYTPEHWERHKSAYRRVKHMLTTFGSSPFQRLLFPDFFVTSLSVGGLTYYNEVVADAAAQVWMDGQGLAAGTTAIALLTGFRLNASYGRYNEGRKLMGAISTASRDLATNSLMWLTRREDKDRMLSLVKAYSVAMTFHLNTKGAHHGIRRNDINFEEQVYVEYRAEMIDVFGNERDGDFVWVCTWHQQGENVPLGISSLMRQIIAHNDQKDALNRELDLQVQKLVASLGGAERIQKTPIPTCFTRHTSRLLFVWSNMLPFAIYPVCGVFTLLTTIAVSYSLMGIEDIGVQLEEPFNILPLRQFSDGVHDGVDFIASAYSGGSVPERDKFSPFQHPRHAQFLYALAGTSSFASFFSCLLAKYSSLSGPPVVSRIPTIRCSASIFTTSAPTPGPKNVSYRFRRFSSAHILYGVSRLCHTMVKANSPSSATSSRSSISWGYALPGTTNPNFLTVVSRWASSPYRWRVTSCLIFWMISVAFCSKTASAPGPERHGTGSISAYLSAAPARKMGMP